MGKEERIPTRQVIWRVLFFRCTTIGIFTARRLRRLRSLNPRFSALSYTEGADCPFRPIPSFKSQRINNKRISFSPNGHLPGGEKDILLLFVRRSRGRENHIYATKQVYLYPRSQRFRKSTHSDHTKLGGCGPYRFAHWGGTSALLGAPKR
jgi:hypothetical protein